MTLKSNNGKDKSILLSPLSTDLNDVDADVTVAAIAAELVHYVLGIHHIVTAANEYRGDLPVAGNVVSGSVPHHRNPNHWHNNIHTTSITQQYQRNID